eukprot:1153615-Pelagomonas_calceolata.AAC.4
MEGDKQGLRDVRLGTPLLTSCPSQSGSISNPLYVLNLRSAASKGPLAAWVAGFPAAAPRFAPAAKIDCNQLADLAAHAQVMQALPRSRQACSPPRLGH